MHEVCMDKTFTTLNPNGIVAYTVYVVLLDFTKQIQRNVKKYIHTLVGLFLISTLETITY